MNTKKRENLLVYTALEMGILCFIFTFIFFGIVIIRYMSGDYSMFAFTFIGVMLSIFAIVKTKKEIGPYFIVTTFIIISTIIYCMDCFINDWCY